MPSNFNFSRLGDADAGYVNYTDVFNRLTALGAGYKRAVPLYKRGYAGDESRIIGQWAWVNGAIVPVGPVDFTQVTSSQYAVVVSRDSATQCTVTGPHTLVTGPARFFDTSAGAEFVDIDIVVSVNTVTIVGILPVALAAGDQVWNTGVCEFTMGGAARDVILLAHATARFVATGLSVLGGGVTLPVLGLFRVGDVRATVASYTALSAVGKFLGAGWRSSAASLTGGAFRRADASIALYINTAHATTNATDLTFVGVSYYGYYTAKHSYTPHVSAQSAAGVGVAQPITADIVSAVPWVVTEDGAVFSGIICG
jgi:hypothetical protein